VNEIDRVIKRGVLCALAGAAVLGVLAYFVAPMIWPGEGPDLAREQTIMVACFVGVVAGWRLSGKR
jgi:hypothetical protein